MVGLYAFIHIMLKFYKVGCGFGTDKKSGVYRKSGFDPDQ